MIMNPNNKKINSINFKMFTRKNKIKKIVNKNKEKINSYQSFNKKE